MNIPTLKSLTSLFPLQTRIQEETEIKKTVTRCITCKKGVPGTVFKKASSVRGIDNVFMRHHCPEHGDHDTLLSSDARFYWLAKGNPTNAEAGCGCGSACSVSTKPNDGYLGKNAINPSDNGIVEKLSTCLALIEIVDSCNLSCPTCFADSPFGTLGEKLKFRSFAEITSRIDGVIRRKGAIEIIQFSGGEPTIHPDFFRLVEWVVAHPKIECLLINTNGVRFAKDAAFVAHMGGILLNPIAASKIQLYLQFDGPQLEGQKELRGADLREIRKRAIHNCESIGLPITLAMTVNRQNLGHLWETVEFTLPYPNIRGISFQPMFMSGRNSTPEALREDAINTADIILGLNAQSNGKINVNDLTPLPCGDPNCAVIGWMFRMNGKFYSPSKFGISIPKMQKSLADRVNYRLEDLQKCGCDNTTLGNLMRRLEKQSVNPIAHTLRLFIKPFMDVRSWDKDRTDRCCTHVIAPDGKLVSFCQYYSGD